MTHADYVINWVEDVALFRSQMMVIASTAAGSWISDVGRMSCRLAPFDVQRH